MRVRLAPALLLSLLAPTLAACSDNEAAVPWTTRASEEKVTDVVDGIGDDEAMALARVAGAPSSIARTPDGATMLAWGVAGMEGEREATAWMTFSPTGRMTGSSSDGSLMTDLPLAYDGGFLMSGPDGAHIGTSVMVSEAGVATTSPRVTAKPRTAKAGDLLLGSYGYPAFRPSDDSFAPLPPDGIDHGGGLPPTILSPSGAVTTLGGTVRRLVFSWSGNGGRTWDHDTVVLPHALVTDQAELYANADRTIMLVHDRKFRLAGWLSRSTGDAGWTTTLLPTPSEDLAIGLVGDRLLITGRVGDGSDAHGGVLVSLADPTDVITVDRHALRASGGRLYSLSPKVSESSDGKTWTDVPLDFSTAD